MSVPPDQMGGSQLDMLAAALRKQFSPTWDASSMGGQNQQQNQTSQTGGMNGLTSLAKALMLRPSGGLTPSTPDVGSGGAAAGAGYGPESAPAAGMLTTPTLGLDATGTAADTAAYTPAAIDATSGGSGLGALAGGLGAGLGAFGAGYGLSRALAGTGNLNPKDMNRNLAGQIATGQQQVAQLQAQGNTSQAAQLQSQIDNWYVQDSQYRKQLGLTPLVNPNSTKDNKGLTWNEQYISSNSGSGGPRKIL